MIRERIADDVYVFRSERYAHVTCGAVITKEGVVLIDTLFYPEETCAVKTFIEERLNQKIVYVVNTHYHADHTMGNCFFPEACIVSHRKCSDLLDEHGRVGLAKMQSQTAEFEDVDIVLPQMVFDEGVFNLHLGGKTLRLQHMPGHSEDMISVHVLKDNILFASDNVMVVPTIFDGRYDDLVGSLNRIQAMKPDCVVQGHGEVILRGEVQKILDEDLHYLTTIKQEVERLVAQKGASADLETIEIEQCGKSRVSLNGLVNDLHHANLYKLYEELSR